MHFADKTISRAIDKLRDEVIRSDKPIVLTFEGETIEVNRKYTNMLRERENVHLCREAKGGKKTKDVSPSQRASIIEDLTSKVDRALREGTGIKVSATLRKSVLEQVHTSLVNRKDSPKNTTFVPRLLYYLDDHFSQFLNDIQLGLLSHNFEGRGNAELRTQLTALERQFVDFLQHRKVGASTVLNALVVFYTNTHKLRGKDSDSTSMMIKMDDRIKKFLEAPMDSMFEGHNLSKNYKATSPVKKLKSGDEITSLAGYRMDHPKKSVKDYLKTVSSADEIANLNHGYIMSKHIMSLVSAHLIPASCFDKEDQDNLSMTVSGGVYTNPNVYTLISLQAVISAGHNEEVVTRTDTRVSSPARSRASTRSVSRETSCTPSRSVSRSVSRSLTRARAR